MPEFFYSTCKTAGLSSSVILRNTPRSGSKTELKPIEVSASVYHNGKNLLTLKLDSIAPGSFLEVREAELRKKLNLSNKGLAELLISFSTEKPGTDSESFFPQEHQINYFSDNPTGFCSVLFDQLPIFSKPRPPVIIISPKVWISKETEVYLVVANRSNMQSTCNAKLQFGIFSSEGECLNRWSDVETINTARVIPLNSYFEKIVSEEKSQRLYNIFGFGGSSSYVIYTVVKDRPSGNLAAEHSLSPHYYFNGDRQRVRHDVLNFDWSLKGFV